MEISRKNRIRRLVKGLNKQRKLQSQKIDIICNDIVISQKNFLKQLKLMSLQIEFYETLIANPNIETILTAFSDSVCTLCGKMNIALWANNSFIAHVFDYQELTNDQTSLIEKCFSSEISDKICKSRRCMDLEDLLEIGMADLSPISRLSSVVIPLQDVEKQSFILIYRDSNSPVVKSQLQTLMPLAAGLNKALSAILPAASNK